MTEEKSVAVPSCYRGNAKIKPEYIIQNHVRELNVNFVASKDKKDDSTHDDKADSSEPPKKKLKGQNKHRPRIKRTPKCEKLCFAYGITGTCPYAENCCYSHDISSYLKTKPENIGETCYMFETYGKCPYSFSCRFGSKHIVDNKNVIKEEISDKFAGKKLTFNVLPNPLMSALRQREYNFDKSHMVVREIKRENNSQEAQFPVKQLPKAKGSELDTEGNPIENVKSESPKPVIKGDEKYTTVENLDNYSGSMYTSFEDAPTKLQPLEIKKVDFKDKLYLAPLTTVGNLPFRRICKEFGADITCGEMAMASSLLQGHKSEWALLKRHHTEDVFGVQLCGAYVDTMTKCSQLLTENIAVDFIDVNMGCPLDLVYKKGAGSGLMNRLKRVDEIIRGMSSVLEVPLTLKMRAGVYAKDFVAHNVIKRIQKWGDNIGLITVHGRSREQRYTKSADWDYINKCCEFSENIPIFGSGDVLSYEDYNLRRKESKISGIMLARGALIKPWIFKEIKEQTHWDISSNERFDMLKSYANYGMEHWGSDTEGVEKTRRFLLEWLSFLYRYIPVGLLEQMPQHINERPPPYHGRNDLETLMASPSCADWVKISEMLLGPVPQNFVFLPKHKANAYQ